MFRILLIVFFGAILPNLDPLTAWGTDMRLTGDFTYSQSEAEIEDRDDGTIENSNFNRFQQIYEIDLNKRLFPKLELDGGARVEQNRTKTESENTTDKSRTQQVLPYLGISWSDPLYSLSGDYREHYLRRKRSLLETQKEYVTTYTLNGEWQPIELPQLSISYLHSERHDIPLTSDIENDNFTVNSRYEFRDYNFLYSYLRSNRSENIRQTETLSSTHNAKVRTDQTLYNGRMNLAGSIRVEYAKLEFYGGGERDFAVSPGGTAFFYVDNDPLPNNNLETDYQTGSFGDSLNLNGNNFLEVGLTFNNATNVDKLKLPLHSEDTLDGGSNISNIDNWAVYTRDGDESWSSRGLVATDYLVDENLFELTIAPGEATESILVVYSPPLISNQLGPLRVVGIRAFITRTLEDETKATAQAYQGQLGLDWRISNATRLAYNTNIEYSKSDLFNDRSINLTNGLNINHLLNDIFIVGGRFSTRHAWEQGALKNTNYFYSARLTGNYFETLRQTLVYSGTFDQDKTNGDASSHSFLLRTNAALYRGWDISFDQGVSNYRSDQGTDSTNYFIRLQNSLQPHRTYKIFLEYSMNWTTESEATERRDSGWVRVSWVPRDTLSLSGEIRLNRIENEYQTSWEYSVSWLPLRDGRVQCALSYFEDEDPNGNRSWSFTPQLIWELTHYASLSFRYSRGEKETTGDMQNFETAFLNFRIFYD